MSPVTPNASRVRVAATAACALAVALVAVLLNAGAASAEAVGIGSFSTGSSTTQAGAHPDVFAEALVSRDPFGALNAEARSISIGLPPGVVGNPNAAPQCDHATVGSALTGGDDAGRPVETGGMVLRACPSNTQVGVARIFAGVVGFGSPGVYSGFDAAVFNVAPRGDDAGRLVIAGPSLPVVFVSIRARTTTDFGLDSVTPEIDGTLTLDGVQITIWGVPSAHVRGGTLCVGVGSGSPSCSVRGPGAIPPAPPSERKAFMTNPTVCDEPKITTLAMTFEQDDLVHRTTSQDPTPTDCGSVPFDPSIDLSATTDKPDAASGLDVTLSVPQSDDPDEIGSSHLRRASVTLPEGVSVNPSAADGLEACTDAQFGFGSNDPVACPAASKVGTVDFDVPLLPGPLQGSVYLGSQLSDDPQSGRMFRIFQYARGFGLNVKIPGYVKADPDTGRLTATLGDLPTLYGSVPAGMLDGLPQVPFDSATLHFKGGDRGILATPLTGGAKTTTTALEPWSGNPDASPSSSLTIDGPASPGFAPSLLAGTVSSAAGSSTPFAFDLSRPGGDDVVAGLTAELPAGLLAKVADVPLCSDADANAGACPEASHVGTATVAAGAGPRPFRISSPVALTGGYKGAPYGLAIAVRAVAGPYDLGTVVVRQAAFVDPVDAHLKVVSDPIPTIRKGVPFRLQDIDVRVDRPGFIQTPTSCSPKTVSGQIHALGGATAPVSSKFQATGCASLPFKPRMALSLTGRSQVTTGKHPGVKATVNQTGLGEAGIKRAVVTLPKSLALDPDNAQALCEFEAGAKPDLEKHCPKGSIVGRARAKTPLLKDDLVGNVYFVKNVRKDPKTGNLIRTLPMLVVALRGEIAINLRGESSTTKAGRLVNTFAQVPDAPIAQFNLDIQGGRNGILAVTRTRKAKINVCASRQIAEADIDGQNGRRHDIDVRIKTPCTKAQVKKAKRAAAKAAKGRR